MKFRLAVILLLALAVFAVFGQTVGFEFVNYDDPAYIYENPHVRKGLAWDSVRWALGAGLCFPSDHADFWIPLTFLSHIAVAQAAGLNPWAHHLLNVLLHTATAILLFLAFDRMTRAPWRSAFVAVLFAIHPLHVESVAWVTERKDVLCGFFWALAMLAYARHAERPTSRRYALVALFMAMGLMSKPMIVTFPFVLLLLDVWPLERAGAGSTTRLAPQRVKWRKAIWEKAPLFAMSAFGVALTFRIQAGHKWVAPMDALPLSLRAQNIAAAYAGYVSKAIYPVALSPFYPFPREGIVLWRLAAATLFLVLMTISSFLVFAKRPYLAIGWLWFLGVLVPVIGIVQVGGQAMADRYTYLPLIGLFIIVSWGAGEIAAGSRARRAAVVVLAAAAVIALMARAYGQTRYWRDGVTLFQHAVDVNPGSAVAQNNLGSALDKEGKTALALRYYETAARLDPRFVKALNNVAGAYAALGNLDEAIQWSRKALGVDPDSVDALSNLGSALAERGNPGEAEQYLKRAVELDPEAREARVNLAAALEAQGKAAEARTQYQEALSLAQAAGDAALAKRIQERLRTPRQPLI